MSLIGNNFTIFRKYSTFSAFPAQGSAGYFYVALDTGFLYIWNNGAYIQAGGGSSARWGNITGNLSDQTDVQNALNGKIDVVSGAIIGTLPTFTSNGQLVDSYKSITLDPTDVTDDTVPTSLAVKTAIGQAISSGRSFRGGWSASSDNYPATGGSGTANAILAGDIWIITSGGFLAGEPVYPGDQIMAIIDTPGQTSSNWIIIPEKELASETQNGLMSSQDYLKSLWAFAVPDLKENGIVPASLNFDSGGNFYSHPEYRTIESFPMTGTRTLFLPDLENDPKKTSNKYDTDYYDITRNKTSQVPLIIKDRNGRDIIDDNGATLTQYVLETSGVSDTITVRFSWNDPNPDPNNRIYPVNWVIIS